MITEWFDGKDNYMKKTFEKDPQGKKHKFTVEVLEQEVPENRHLNEILQDHVSHRQTKTVEVLYSGGVDSEAVLNSLHVSGVPIKAITMRLLVRGCAINTHDLYYSEKFCRQRGINQKIVELDAKTFYESGKFLDYTAPYSIPSPHCGSYFWLFEQTTGFPVNGGDYFWPWTYGPNHMENKIISPSRYDYACNQLFLRDRGIDGIGDMLKWSLEGNIHMMKAHIAAMDSGTFYGLYDFKKKMHSILGFEDCEQRTQNYGYNYVSKSMLDIDRIKEENTIKNGDVESVIVWKKQIADILGGVPGSNNRYM